MFKRYEISVDLWAALLFAAVMLPNCIWFAVPAPNDILRVESVTPVLDAVASFCQVLFVALLVLVKSKGIADIKFTSGITCVIIWYAVYILAWILYYQGNTDSVIIVLLCFMPCLAFGSYAADRKNIPAMIPLAVFSVCHLSYGVLNFI